MALKKTASANPTGPLDDYHRRDRPPSDGAAAPTQAPPPRGVPPPRGPEYHCRAKPEKSELR